MSSTPQSFGFGTDGFGYGGFGMEWGQGPIPFYYLSLLTSQYQSSSPNFLSWLTAPLLIMDGVTQCLANFDAAFDLDIAVGPQLDVLGQLIGQSRTVGFQPSDSVSPTLTDPTYLLLLRARVAQNSWDGTIDSLQGIWQTLFPGGTIAIEDSQNMTATILLTGAFSSILQDLITNGYIVPRPAGVQYTYNFSTLPAFGFDVSNAYIAGFDVGHF
jgi:hypothetical protein